MPSTHLTDLEYRILQKFCELTNQDIPEIESIKVLRRVRNPVGFMTEVKNIKKDSTLEYEKRIYQEFPDANYGWEKGIIGFLIYFDDGCLDAIEGVTHGEEWPEDEHRIIF